MGRENRERVHIEPPAHSVSLNDAAPNPLPQRFPLRGTVTAALPNGWRQIVSWDLTEVFNIRSVADVGTAGLVDMMRTASGQWHTFTPVEFLLRLWDADFGAWSRDADPA